MRWSERRAEASAAQRMNLRARFGDRSDRFAALFLFVFAALLFVSPVARAQQSSDAPPTGNAQNGKKLFMSDGCYECHGRQGQGAAQTGAARVGPP